MRVGAEEGAGEAAAADEAAALLRPLAVVAGAEVVVAALCT